MPENLVAYADRTRERLGYIGVSEIIADTRNTVIDPYSVLISKHVQIGTGNVFYPGVRIDAEPGSTQIGNNNRFFEGSRIDATRGGRLVIGDDNAIGPHAVALLVNRAGAVTTIGNRTRLLGRVDIIGTCVLEDGSQIIGDISAMNIMLSGGDDHGGPDPDLRGAVLKGRGRASSITLSRGKVINGDGDFALAPVEDQSVYHPRASGSEA